jgi:hypothetical protein
MVSVHLSSQHSSMANPNPATPKFMPNVTQLGSIKLEGPNYLGWVAQLQPILCGYDLQGLLYGSEPCPPQLIANATGDAQIPNLAYVSWLRRDQQLLNLIICSLAPSLVPSMYGLKTSRLAGSNLATWFAATSRSRISHLKRQLQGLQQGNKTCSEYLNQAKTWADKLSAIGEPVDDDDLISFIINGINPTFNSFITTFTLHDRETSFHDFQSELLSHEILLQNQHTTAPEAGSFALHAHRTIPSYTNNPNFRKPKFFPKPPGQYRHTSPHNQFHNPPFSPRHSPNFSPRYHPLLPPPLPITEPSNHETSPPPPR